MQLPCPVIGIGPTPQACCDVVLTDTRDLDLIYDNIQRAPLTALVLVQQLRLQEKLSLTEALTSESLAYATVQNGPEFKHWLDSYTPDVMAETQPDTPLTLEITDGTLALTFNRPDAHNAIDVTMRDALCEAFELALSDPDIQQVTLTGTGRTFSTGGEVAEFGSVSDPATAHWIRGLRLPAQKIAQLGTPFHVHVNGAAIGAGAEIAAFGAHVSAPPEAWFQLPELKYGLIPGAGGTASLPRKMDGGPLGRQRTAYMALSMKKIRAQTALDWGLVDAIVE